MKVDHDDSLCKIATYSTPKRTGDALSEKKQAAMSQTQKRPANTKRITENTLNVPKMNNREQSAVNKAGKHNASFISSKSKTSIMSKGSFVSSRRPNNQKALSTHRGCVPTTPRRGGVTQRDIPTVPRPKKTVQQAAMHKRMNSNRVQTNRQMSHTAISMSSQTSPTLLKPTKQFSQHSSLKAQGELSELTSQMTMQMQITANDNAEVSE